MNNINDYNPIIEKIYKETAKTVYQYLYCITNNQEVAEEITQETFCVAMQHMNKYKEEVKITVWLCQIAKQLLYKQYKKELRMAYIDENIETNDIKKLK